MGIQPYDPENRQGELRHVIVDAYEGETLPGPSTRICLAFGQPPSRSIDWSLAGFFRRVPRARHLALS